MADDKSRVTLVFNRPISDAELKQIQNTHDAIEAARMEGHHDHDHPSIAADLAQQVEQPS